MDLRHLRHVALLAEERNFARAAARAHLSQSAFSRSIQALEDEIGLKLFDRGPRHVALTAAGDLVVMRARRVLFETRALTQDLQQFKTGDLGPVVLGVGPNVAAGVLPQALAALHRRHPAVQVRAEVSSWEQLWQRLLTEQIDFFLADTRDLPVHPDVVTTVVAGHGGALFCRRGHPLLTRTDLSVADIMACRFAAIRLPQPVRQQLGDFLGLAPGQTVPIAVECDNVFVLRELAAQTDLVLLTTHSSIREELASGSLVELPVPGLPAVSARWGVVQRAGRTLPPAATLMITLLISEIDRGLAAG